MEISQLTPVITRIGDSISNHVFEIRGLLAKQGFQSKIYVEHKDSFFLPDFVKNYRSCRPKKEDIVILHATVGSNLTNFFRNLKCKKMIIYHNHTPAKFFEGVNNDIMRLLKNYDTDLKSLVRSTDSVLGVSEFNKQDLEKLGFRNVKVSPIFIDFNKFKKLNQTLISKFDDKWVNIIHVGRIVPNKKIEDLIKVFYYYKNFINPKSRLLLIGGITTVPNYYESLLEYVDKLNLKDVFFTNKVSDKDLATYYCLSDIFLSMSEHEGLGLPLIESMYFDIPIIAFNSTGIPHTLGNSSILVNKKNFRGIAELIDVILNNKKIKENIIKGQKKKLKDFDSEKLKKQFLQHIIDLKDSKKIKDNRDEEIKKLKLLCVLPGGVGDVIMFTPILRGLKEKYKDTEIDFLTSDYCKDILIGNPNITNVYTDETSINLKDYFQVLRPYTKTQSIPDWQKTGIHIIDLYANLCGITLEDYKTEVYPLEVDLQSYGIRANEDYICLHTQSSLKCKDWPYFKDLIEKLKDNFQIVVIDEQQHNYPHTIQLPPDMKLREKAYVISKSKMIIGIDSMGIHLSSALGIPTIAIYGNTLPELCKPLSNKKLITLIPKKRCTEGWHHICKEGEHCINSISVEEILEKVGYLTSK